MIFSRSTSVARVFALAVIVFAGTVAVSAAAFAENGRFVMKETEVGMLRLDTQTGAVSFCSTRSGIWSCTLVEDDSQVLDARIRDLEKENQQLRAEIRELRADLELRDKDAVTEVPKRSVPNDEELEKAFSFLEKMFRKFKDVVKDLEEPQPKGTPL